MFSTLWSHKKKTIILLALSATFFSIGLLCVLVLIPQSDTSFPLNTDAFSDESIDSFLASNPSFPELSLYLGNVADTRGAVVALNVLIYGVLPSSIDTHLMGHFVARKLYKEQGIEGLTHCTSDLGYACAHALVVESLFERGVDVFSDINNICANVQGDGGYMMCFHGFGHGVLAYTEFKLKEAIELCEFVGTEAYDNQEIDECLGGVIMEMRDGMHDPTLWEQNGKKYLDATDPLALCSSAYLPEKYRYMCYIYITPFIFDSIGAADLPTLEEYEKAIATCDTIQEPEFRNACFGGFGKEFVSFRYGRDVRQIANATYDDLEYMKDACYFAKVADGIQSCITNTIYSLYRTGQYHYSIAGNFCTHVEEEQKQGCINTFTDVVLNTETKNANHKNEVCAFLEATFGETCTQESQNGNKNP